MALTAANYTANLKTADGNVRAQLSLPGSRADWTYEQRSAYNHALAAIIVAHPDSFSDTSLQVASYEVQKVDSPLQDDGTSFGEFIDNAIAAERSINPLDPQNAGTTAKYLLGAAVVIGLGYVFVKYGLPVILERRAPAAAA